MENNKLKEAMEEEQPWRDYNMSKEAYFKMVKRVIDSSTVKTKEYVETEITDEKAIEKYWSIVSDNDQNKPEKYKSKTLRNKVFEALGEVSMCWSETPKGVFDSTNAERIGNELIEFIENQGKTYLVDTKLIPENMNVEEFIKTFKNQPIQLVYPKPDLKESLEVLCNALREDKEYYNKVVKSLSLNTKTIIDNVKSVEFMPVEDLNNYIENHYENFLNILINK